MEVIVVENNCVPMATLVVEKNPGVDVPTRRITVLDVVDMLFPSSEKVVPNTLKASAVIGTRKPVNHSTSNNTGDRCGASFPRASFWFVLVCGGCWNSRPCGIRFHLGRRVRRWVKKNSLYIECANERTVVKKPLSMPRC